MTQSAIKTASNYCKMNKLRFTDPRREVLKIIASHTKPLGAYEILEKLGMVIQNPKPPTVYRAIEFWQEHGFIHRIESLNAYTACEAGHRHKGSQFMICDSCGIVTEAHLCDLPQPLQETATKHTFKPSSWNLEIHGTCEKCA